MYQVALAVNDNDGFSTTVTCDVVVGSPVSFIVAEQSINENGGAVLITAQLDNGVFLNHDVTIPLLVGGDVTGADYTLPTAEIVISQGQLTGSTSLQINDDSLDENDEQLLVGMGQTVGASHGIVNEQRVFILDNDAMPSVFLVTPQRDDRRECGEY